MEASKIDDPESAVGVRSRQQRGKNIRAAGGMRGQRLRTGRALHSHGETPQIFCDVFNFLKAVRKAVIYRKLFCGFETST
jgi:hypothetical protein